MVDFSTTTASNVIAVSLGLLTLVVGVVIPAMTRWLRARRADLEVRFERFWRQDIPRLAARFVIKNHGSALARDILLSRLMDTRGQQLDIDSLATSATPPVAQLLPGQEFHVIVDFTLNMGDPIRVDAEWHDRSGRHEAQFVVSPHYV